MQRLFDWDKTCLEHTNQGLNTRGVTYTTDMDEAKLEALSLEVEPTAESLIELLDLDDL